MAVNQENRNGSHAIVSNGCSGNVSGCIRPYCLPAVDLVIVPKRHHKLNSSISRRNPRIPSLIKEIGGYVVLRREQNACPDISRDGIAAPGGLEPETASGVKA